MTMKNKKKNKKLALKTLQLCEKKGEPATTFSYPQLMQRLRQLATGGAIFDAEFLALQAYSLLPKDEYVLISLINIYSGMGRFERAEGYVAKALKLFPRSIDTLVCIAEYYRLSGAFEMGITLLERGRKLHPKNVELVYSLSSLLFTRGESRQAAVLCGQAISLKNDHAASYWGRAQVLKSQVPATVITDLESLIASGQCAGSDLAQLHFAAAWHWGDENVAKHFHHLEQANQLMQVQRPWDKTQQQRQFELLKKFIGPGLLAALNSDRAVTPTGPIFLAAMPRSGSTLLEQLLSRHSHIQSAGESQAFTHAVHEVAHSNNLRPHYWQWPGGKYLAPLLLQLDQCVQKHSAVAAANGKRLLDKSMDNARDTGLLLLTCPNARVIHLQREPLDTILSAYRLYFAGGYNYSFSLESLASYYRLQQQQMEYWKTLFPGRIVTVSYEALVSDVQGTITGLLGALDLPLEQACWNYQGSTTLINTASSAQVREAIHQRAVGQGQQYLAYLTPAVRILGTED